MGFKTKILDHTHEMTEAKFPGGKLLEKLLIALVATPGFIDNRFYKDANAFGDCGVDNQELDGWRSPSFKYL